MPPRIGDAAALAWLLGLSLLIVTPDVLAGSSVHLTSMIIVLCALAAGLCSLRMTVVAALLTATVRPLLYLTEPPASVADGVVSAVVTAMVAALAGEFYPLEDRLPAWRGLGRDGRGPAA
ncbi:hypothetical protein ACFZB9_18705 [Kitasatospora sp. NPDC008050]|uniref:hypothetical protein n=1 Tax=Kitasatospora sp. NPDC008050 TaxID=3364021 RepID=UPI0036E70309